jgi:hypothetical protein
LSKTTSTLVMAAIGCAIASGCASSAAAFAQFGTSAAQTQETDQQRRERLNARMSEMVRTGSGARLAQPTATPPRRSAPSGRRSRRPSTTTPAVAPVATAPVATAPITRASVDAPSVTESWTIQPPAYVGGPAPRSSGAYYTPPVLDLVTAPRVPTDDVECLTQAIYYEARNESEEGQAAVAEVVMNRSRSGVYPRAVCAVVYQRNSRTCQFTFTCDGAIGRSPVDLVKWARAERIARDVIAGRTPANLPRTSLNYHASYVSPSWGRRLERVRQIGTHIFYGAALGGGVTPGALTPAAPPRPATSGLVFVRNEALDRAYETARAAAPTSQP